ncbi:CMRF35-like molecule 5 [Castor canadensis]|uniref:CMRF35-like molecule 5 n=1 Tax=Castor canadensis TaxID=51338 RepID=A0AC58KJB8_CASCN
MWLGSSLFFLLLLLGCFTAQSSITGPEKVSGLERGSLTVQCHYTSSWKTYKKWWCRGANWESCQVLVTTSGSEQEVKEDRVSIKDDQKKFLFTVTMEDLRRDDTDMYWCGIERIGIDLGVKVNVIIDPESSAIITTTKATSLTSTPSATEKTTSNQPMTLTTPLARSLLSNTHFLLLVFLEVPLFLSLLSAVLWVTRPLRRPRVRRNQPDFDNQYF